MRAITLTSPLHLTMAASVALVGAIETTSANILAKHVISPQTGRMLADDSDLKQFQIIGSTSHTGFSLLGRDNSVTKTKALYDSRDWNCVSFYLKERPQASQELALSHPALCLIFGSERKARLHVQVAPDNDGPSMLVAYIPVKGGADDAFRRMQQFDEWCLDNLPMNSGVIFDVEFD